MSVYSLASASNSLELIKFDDESSVEAAKGREFVESVISHSSNRSKNVPRKEYNKFRKIFWEEPIYNASILNPCRISYDQQFGEMKAHWSRAGKKFSMEPRISKHSLYEHPGGPDKPEEFPHVSEKAVPYWGHERQIDPLRVARFTARPMLRTVPRQKLTRIEETAHLGPGVYKLPDPWLESTKPVCGIVRPTSCFKSTSRKEGIIPDPKRTLSPPKSALRNLLQLPEGKPHRAEEPSTIIPLQTGLRMSTSINELYPSRATTSFVTHHSTTLPSPAQLGNNALSPSETPCVPNEAMLAGYYQLGTSETHSLSTLDGDQMLRTSPSHLIGFGFDAPNNHHSSVNTNLNMNTNPPSTTHSYNRSQGGLVSGGVGGTGVTPSKQGSPKRNVKGFSFLKGTLGASALEVVTGTTQADILYRRVQTKDGEHLIIPVSRICMYMYGV